MPDQYLGEIRMFGFNFAPQGWAFCNGQILPISQNTALFALLGTTYGGNGQTTFALPDLQARVAIHQGQGVGLSLYALGQVGGTETVSLSPNQMPQHSHAVNASSAPGTSARPAGAVPARAPDNIYAASSDGTTMSSSMIGTAGGSQAHSNIQPYLTLCFCIALQGIFPSRN